MYSALYFPFTKPESRSFLKTALFLWDSVDFIVPYRDFRPYVETKEEAEAIEIVGRNYVPTEKDKLAVHEELTDICNNNLPEQLSFELTKPGLEYNFYPQKLLHETWEMLSQSKLAKIVSDADEIRMAATSPLFGYYMMSILAICCSNGRKKLVTDENDPYKTLANILIDYAPTKDAQIDWHTHLLSLTLDGPNFTNVPLQRLIYLRKKEDKLLFELRRNFLSAVDKTVTEISSNADNPNIVQELVDSFKKEMELDLRELKRALRRSATSVLLSKEFGFSILAATASVSIEPISGGILTIGGLTKGLLDYQDRRRKILREHSSSWLFRATESMVPII